MTEATTANTTENPTQATTSAPPAPAPEVVKPKKEKKQKGPPRSALSKLFVIKPFGYLRLLALCVLVGFIMLTLRFDPTDPGFDASRTIADLWQNFWAAASWAARNLWKPALAGATIVLPIWILWRLVTLPFRR